MEEQLKEINEKCSKLEKRENSIRKCIKKMSSRHDITTVSDIPLPDYKMSNDNIEEMPSTNAGSRAQYLEDDCLRDIDYQKIIKGAMKDYPLSSIKEADKSSKFLYDYDEDVVDVDEVIDGDKGIGAPNFLYLACAHLRYTTYFTNIHT